MNAGDNFPSGTVYLSKAKAAGDSESREYFDRLGRAMRQASRGFDGQWVNGASVWATMNYDILGRATHPLPLLSSGLIALRIKWCT